MLKRWQHRATTDQCQVWTWWDRWPWANIGCTTGHLFDAVDLDGPGARAHFEHLCTLTGHAFTGPIMRTGRREGGWQLLYAPTGFGNRRPSPARIDYRGKGGYTILPPSVHPTGNVYTWLREPCGEFPELPQRLREHLWTGREPTVPTHRHAGHVPVATLERWALSALDGIQAELEATPRGMGQRNEALNRCAFRAYQLAHALGEERITDALLRSASRIGYLEDKGTTRTLSTLRSATAGISQPRYPIGGTR